MGDRWMWGWSGSGERRTGVLNFVSGVGCGECVRLQPGDTARYRCNRRSAGAMISSSSSSAFWQGGAGRRQARCRSRPSRSLVRACSATQSSELEEHKESEKEVKVVLPKVVPVTVISGSDAKLKRDFILDLLRALPDRRVLVVSTSSYEKPETHAGQNGATKPEELPTSEEAEATAENGAQSAQASESISVDENGETKSDHSWNFCTSFPQALDALEATAQMRESFDYVIFESGGEVSDVREIANGITKMQTTRVDSMVSIVNVETFLDDLYMNDSAMDKTAGALDYQGATNLVNYVENANVVILSSPNSSASEDTTAQVQNLVLSLNSTADIFRLNDEKFNIEAIVGTGKFDLESFELSPSWKRVLIADRETPLGDEAKGTKSLPKSVKDSSFLYRGKRPFHPTRLYNYIKDMRTFSGVIKSVGKLWLATRMNYPLTWNQAGGTITLKQGERFWASLPEDRWPKEQREELLTRWDERFGDRETEIVFIGRDFDKSKLESLLDSCLLQDDEMVFNQAWESFDDPFVVFVPAESDEEEEDSVEDENEDNVEVERIEDVDAALEKKLGEESAEMDPIPSEVNEEDRDTASEGDEVIDVQSKVSAIDGVEGKLNSVESIPEDLLERVSKLELSSESDLQLNPTAKDYDERNAIIASGDSRVVNEILGSIPRRGLAVTVVTGFLGAGKTSLINYILTQEHGLKIAVLVNEFGEIDIDNQIVETDWEDDDTIMLNNGCICCSINDSFLSAVHRVLEKADAVDYLIVETTGVADPVPIVNSLMATELEELVYVDSIVTLVDAEHFDPDTHMRSEAALSQIAVADTVLLSKTDLASPSKIEQVTNFIQKMRPGARILRSQRGAVPLKMILDVRLNESASKNSDETAIVNHEHESEVAADHSDCDHDHGICNHDHEHDHDHDHEHEHEQRHEHDHEHNHEHEAKSNHIEVDGFMSTSFQTTEPFDLDLFFDKFLSKLPDGVFRSKGLLYFKGYPKRYIFQLSGRRYQLEEDEWPEGASPSNQVVVIGRDLDIEELREKLGACRASEKVT